MAFKNADVLAVLQSINLGSSVAESDSLLESARVDTSAFSDLILDRVDLIPGTKGSGKSALYRIMVEFLPDFLLKQQRAVIAHGVNRHGDSVFQVFNNEFNQLSEDDFVDFWCIYIVSLVQDQFFKNERYATSVKGHSHYINSFQETCRAAGIPEIEAKKSLREVLAWALNALKIFAPKLKYKPPDMQGEYSLELFAGLPTSGTKTQENQGRQLPLYVDKLRTELNTLLEHCSLSIWFMVDKLDEVFPRRSDLERRALRGLLRTMLVFSTERIRIKIFLRDDMLSEVVAGGEGFTALTHLTARQADTLRWSEDQILTMICNRLYSNDQLVRMLGVSKEELGANQTSRNQAFYKVFPPTVHSGKRQSNTMRWIYNHTQDGNGVVTPRDAIELVTKAIQAQVSALLSNPTGESPFVIGPQSILYGWAELSKHKRTTYLEAEFPHLWNQIKLVIGGKAEYTERAIKRTFGSNWQRITSDFSSIGLMSQVKSEKGQLYRIPFLYRRGLDISQGLQD